MSLDADFLKSKKSSLDRATRDLGKIRREVLQVVDGLAGAEGAQRGVLVASLSPKIQLLRDKCKSVDELLMEFEQRAASSGINTHQDDQNSWGDLLYEAEKTAAEAADLFLHLTGNHPSTSAATRPDPQADGAASQTSGLADQLSRMVSLLEKQQKTGASGSGERSGGSGVQYSKLPKLELPKFEGDILKWRPFWDRFVESVDKNDKLAPVDKLNYLIGMLGEVPQKNIATLPLTNDTYDTAKALLQSQYGDQRMVITLLYRRLNEMKPVKNDPVALRAFIADIDCVLGSLGSMGQNTSDDNFATIIMTKLPSSVVIHLEMDKPVNDPWTVALVRSKLTDYLTRLDRTAKISAISKASSSGGGSYEFTGDSLFAGESGQARKKKGGPVKQKPDSHSGQGAKRPGQNEERRVSCVYCGGGHYPDKCGKYRTADDRFRNLGGRCIVCLGDNHKKGECRTRKPCFYCRKVGNHHSTLCFQQFGKTANSGHFAAAQDPPNSQLPTSRGDESSLLALGEGVTMQTAQVPIKVNNDRIKSFRVKRTVFDPGCNRTYCTQNLAEELDIPLKPGPTLTVNRFGSDRPITMKTKIGVLQLRKLDGSLASIDVCVAPQITGRLTRMPVKSENLVKLGMRVKLADKMPTQFESSAVDLLIGNDYYLDFITGEKISVDPGLWLLGSEFGYILSGRSALTRQSAHAVSMCGFTATAMPGLDDLAALPRDEKMTLKEPPQHDFWKMETLGITDSPEQKADDIAAESFRETVKFRNGRFEVGLPKNDRISELRDDYALSVGRLGSLVKKLRPNDALFEQYNSVIDGQIQKGVVEKVDSPKNREGTHYIPHHAVVNPDRETTKLRVVYDGSAKAHRDSPSLNECLYRGPIILDDLAGLVLRFRTHQIAVISDLEKAFLQIGIDPNDRDLLRFLWLSNPQIRDVKNNIAEYRFCRVVFGLNCSPSLLGQTVKYHLQKSGGPVAEKIQRDIYVNNVITGVETVSDGEKFYRESKQIFSEASMNLRSWASNSPVLMAKIPDADRMKNTESIKVMGYKWNNAKDTLSVSPSPRLNLGAQSKRELLSQLASVFDPLGFFSPVSIPAKVLLQEVCKTNADWDDQLPDAVIEECKLQRDRLEEISQVPVPRVIESRGRCSLVAFCDASTSAFATLIYLRCQTRSGVYVNLTLSKTWLNPMKKLTIPRMELMAILIGVRGLNFVARHLGFQIVEGTCFTDSSSALGWLKCQTKQDLFVKNRVREIAKSKWLTHRYVKTDHNPADWATRGKGAKELDRFWWQGPDWLGKDRPEWPSWAFTEVAAKESEPSPKPIHQISLLNTDSGPLPFDLDPSHFSSHRKLIRVSAWCRRFIDGCKGSRPKNEFLTAEELEAAEAFWVKSVQAEAYGKGDPNSNQAFRFGNLWLFRDADGFIRSKGRMANAAIPWDAKYPKLLPPKHAFTRLVVRRFHEENGHAGVLHTHSLLRLSYWVPRGRQVVKSEVGQCVTCKKASGRPYALPQMPELLTERVRPQPPFNSTGVDYFGPLKVKGANKTEKAWVALFTCLTTRAVHLELVASLSAEEFLLAFRRFIARRGKPMIMVSDNAPQFKSVAKAVGLAWAEVITDPSIMNFSAGQGITWKFIVEYAPYMGGVYERLVGVVKNCLRKTVGQALLSSRQFETLLFECESVINSRPLTFVASGVDDGVVLTPAHFLSLNPKIAVSSIPKGEIWDRFAEEGPTVESLGEEWRKGNKLLDELWNRWIREYLDTLRSQMVYAHKNNQGSQKTPKPGDVIILKNVSLPRGRWRLGKIVQIHESADRKVRSVSVQLPSGNILRRPKNLVIPLECSGLGGSSAQKTTDRAPSQIGAEREKTDDYESDSTSGRNSPELFACEHGSYSLSQAESSFWGSGSRGLNLGPKAW